ncbi:type II CRISPR RNA-guided endonuclease Cas9 [Pseudoflavitalea rhizosphaerae]|uniref:type II CRISPR RNA-guided endonuclease Cas9 n=1 Tax=Pseudoflavitalea rhizosphaerae TaxID=1884793 RepID=UPI0019D2DB21|nr:type II CRISPR RNA-guided endonuclease Cas9 [Pseudoflavitalea rhizosphaerae]
MKKIILGLDLGTNSIGWALTLQSSNGNKILASGCRIIPMSQDELSNFDKGQSQSPTAERTRLRTARRLRERKLLRRERLHRILNLCGFLPNHYAAQIDFINHPGKFFPGTEPKLSSIPGATGEAAFYFMDSFHEMVRDFATHQPQIVAGGKSIPANWTIYFLRKKALTQKISKEELAWILLHFNQKRGYNQLREEEEDATPKKQVEYKSLLVTKVVEEEKKKDETWYAIHLENGFIYKRKSKSPINWEGSYRDFIVTTDLNEDGSVKNDKYGKESRSIRAPLADDWTLLKKKTEADLEKSKKTPGEYIYDALLQNPSQKIKGRLINVIERKYYKEEIQLILQRQATFHPEFANEALFKQCLEELYPHNINHRNHLQPKGIAYLLIEDILFYQRPLKSKKSLISNCRFEFRL